MVRIPLSTMRHEVTIEPSTGNRGDGETYGTPYTVRGNLDRQRRLVRSSTGDTITVEATLLLRPGIAVKNRDRVTAGSDTFVVEKVMPAPVGSHEHHVEVWLK